ncbi:MAG: anti-sigma factor RsbA family regulatory protein [Pseudonocardia sp.]
MTTAVADPPAGLYHPALFYSDAASYLEGVLGFVRDGLDRNEPVLVAVPEPNLSLIRSELTAEERALVRTADMAVAGRNPGRIIGSVLTPFVEEHPHQRVRIVGEPIWAGRSAEEYPACAEHEALINVALGASPAAILCPYDTVRLAPAVLDDATRTHPVLASGSSRWTSPAYTDPLSLAASFDRPLSAPPPDADVLVVTALGGPASARRFVHEFAEQASMTPARIADLRLIAQELATNTILHSGGSGLLSIWAVDGHIVCQLEDGGRINDPLVGRRPPGPSKIGHGLHAVHRVADLVRVHRDAHGTTVRVHVAIELDR